MQNAVENANAVRMFAGSRMKLRGVASNKINLNLCFVLI